MIAISVTPGKTAEVQALIASLGSKLQPEIAEAANRAAKGVSTDGKRMIHDQFGFPAGEAVKYIKVDKAAKKDGGTMASATFESGQMSLMKFKPSPSSPVTGRRASGGVTVNIGGKSINFARAFIANLGKKPGIYERVGDKRFPVKGLYTRSIPQLIQDAQHGGANEQVIANGMQERFEARFIQQCNRLIAEQGIR